MRKRIACTVAAIMVGAAAAAPPPHDTARTHTAAWRGLSAGVDDAGRLLWWYSTATGRESRRLDENGKVLERRFANGDTRSCRYDEDGRPVEVISASAGGALRTVIEWRGYDARRILHPHEDETRRHDAHGRLVGRVVHRPALSAHESEYSYREDFAWDASGRLLRHDLPEGGSLTHEYDKHGRVMRIEWQQGRQRRTLLPLAEHDSAARGGGASKDDGAARKGDGANGDGASHRDSDAAAAPPVLRQRLHYDPMGRLWGRHLQIGNWHAAWAYAYGADAEMIAAAVRMRGVPAPQAQALQGDAAAAEPRIQRQWLYARRPSGAALATRADALTLRHDVQRDASGLPARAGGRRLEYGPDRRLRSVWENGRQLARYVHNACGERIRRYDATGIRHYLYGQDHFRDAEDDFHHGQDHCLLAHGPLALGVQPGSALRAPEHPTTRARHHLAAEARPLPGGAVGVTRRYVYAGAAPIAIIEYPQPRALVPRPAAAAPAMSPPVFYAVHTDPGGVPYAVTDTALRIRWRAVLSPTGVPVAEEGDLPMPLRRPGHVRDGASGWHDNGLRTYDPWAGHYLEPDPVGPRAGGSPYDGSPYDGNPYGHPGLAAFPHPRGNDVTTAQDEAVTVDIRGYSKWLREALAAGMPPRRGGGSG